MSDNRNDSINKYNREPELQAKADSLITEELAPEQLQDNASADVPELSEIEKEARSLGWQSKEEREASGKNNKYFVSPEEYVSRRPLFDRINNQTQQIQELRDLQKQQSDYLAKARKESYEQALKDLEAKRDFAVSEADRDSFKAYDRQHQDLQRKMYEDQMMQQAQKPNLTPDVQNFVNRNQGWYNTQNAENSKMKAAADAFDSYLMNQHRANGVNPDVNQHLAAIESEVKRLFPHKFAAVESDKPAASQAVTRSTAPVRPVESKDLVRLLTPEQREIGEYLMRANKDFTLDLYAQELKKANRLGK